jgi:vacuolar-type H+-ATPase subunit E/Vma4
MVASSCFAEHHPWFAESCATLRAVQVLLDAKVGAVKDAIIATSTEATQEASLEDLLAKVVAKWADIELSVIPYKDSKDIYILGSIDNIQVWIRALKHGR